MSFRKAISTALIISLALLTLSACGAAGAAGAEFKVTATDFKFDPADLTFKAGAKVKLTLANKGAVEHTWILKSPDGQELSPKLTANVGQTKSIEFTAPAAGSYQIVCDVAGHKEQGMVGKATTQ